MEIGGSGFARLRFSLLRRGFIVLVDWGRREEVQRVVEVAFRDVLKDRVSVASFESVLDFVHLYIDSVC